MDRSILIADADPEWSRHCQLFLSQKGFDVVTAAGGVECLGILRLVTPAVLVLDQGIAWGGSDGVLARLREDWGTFPLPAVLLTGGAPAEDRSALVVRPVVKYLAKPYPLSTLLDEVYSLTHRSLLGRLLASRN